MSHRPGLAASERRRALGAASDMAVRRPWTQSDREELYKWMEPWYAGSRLAAESHRRIWTRASIAVALSSA